MCINGASPQVIDKERSISDLSVHDRFAIAITILSRQCHTTAIIQEANCCAKWTVREGGLCQVWSPSPRIEQDRPLSPCSFDMFGCLLRLIPFQTSLRPCHDKDTSDVIMSLHIAIDVTEFRRSSDDLYGYG